MAFRWLSCLFLASIAFGQAAPPAPRGSGEAKIEQATPTTPDKAPATEVGPNDTVLTVRGACEDPSKQGDDCVTKLSRAQFEKLCDTLQPNMPPAVRRRFAGDYSRMLSMSTAAEKRGLDKTPRFGEMLRLSRMQLLSMELNRAVQEEAGKVSDTDLESYYSKNVSAYEEATFARIFIPAGKQITEPEADMKDEEIQAQQEAGQAEMKKIAVALHTRAANGEDPDKLQKEAFVAAGRQQSPPTTKMEKVRRTTLAPHGELVDLKPGQVSELISDSGGHYIYKLLSKQTLPLDAVKQEISTTLSGQRYRDAMQSFQAGNAELNDAYFGPARNPAPSASPQASKPGNKAAVDPN